MELPDNLEITELDLSYKNLLVCPDLFRYTKLIKLNISHNKITKLDNLPHNLQILICNYNKITQLDNLPINLILLNCSYNELTKLDNLTPSLKKLDCSYNQITRLDNLQPNLLELFCSYKIIQLDNLTTVDFHLSLYVFYHIFLKKSNKLTWKSTVYIYGLSVKKLIENCIVICSNNKLLIIK